MTLINQRPITRNFNNFKELYIYIYKAKTDIAFQLESNFAYYILFMFFLIFISSELILYRKQGVQNSCSKNNN